MNWFALFAALAMEKASRNPNPDRPRFRFGEFLIGMCKIGAFIFLTSMAIGLTIGLIERAHGQTQTYQDSMGRQTGTSTTNGNTTTFSDSMGRQTGRAVTNGSTTTIYNPLGQQTGTIRSKR
jgi:hypothetical protein